MKYFAHNGIDHHSAAEAAAHSASDVWPAVIMVTAAVAFFIVLAVWLTRKLGGETVSVKDKEK